MINESYIIKTLQARLSRNRMQHSLQVAETAEKLAFHYGGDEEKARLAGLVHDCAKGLSGAELIEIARQNQLYMHEIDFEIPDLLHAPVGSFLAQREFAIEDPQILRAIQIHTLGAPEMSRLDKIIYLADMIEPGRDYPGLERLTCLTWRDLDAAMLFALESTIKYCLDRGRILHPLTVQARNAFLRQVEAAGGINC